MQPLNDSTSLKQALKPVLLLKQPKFSELIREVRRLSQLTQGQFAAAIGVSYVTVSRWESSRMQPSALALRQVQAFVAQLSQSSHSNGASAGKCVACVVFCRAATVDSENGTTEQRRFMDW